MRYQLLKESHDQLGHKGFYATQHTLGDRFQWLTINTDVQWIISTCYQYQILFFKQVVFLLTVQIPAPLFCKAYINTLHMPPSYGYKYIVQARDSLTGWPEWCVLTCKTNRTLGQFLFEEILCYQEELEEIVTDNGSAFMATLDQIAIRYHIHHIRILAYNLQANGVVETTHWTIRDSLVKICHRNIKKWYKHAPYVFWTNRVTTRKSTGMTPFYAVHGVKLLLSFDITEATFLTAKFFKQLLTASLLVIHARILQKCDEDLAKIHDHVLATCYASTQEFERKNINHIVNYDFKAGELILVLNKKIEPDIGWKCKPCYFGPMVVVTWLQNGTYILSEVDGAISYLKFTAFCLIPYQARSQKCLEITEFVDWKELKEIEEERTVDNIDVILEKKGEVWGQQLGYLCNMLYYFLSISISIN